MKESELDNVCTVSVAVTDGVLMAMEFTGISPRTALLYSFASLLRMVEAATVPGTNVYEEAKILLHEARIPADLLRLADPPVDRVH